MQRRLIVESTVIAVTAAALAFFILTLLHAHLGDPAIHHFDLAVQARIHATTTPTLTLVMRFLSFIGSTQVFIPTLLLALGILLAIGEKEQGRRLVRKRQTSTLFAVAIGGALILNEFFKHHFHRTRPQVPWTIGHEPSFSYPSGHSLFSFILYGLIAYSVLTRHSPLRRRVPVALAAVAITLAIGASRVYLGLHYPTDVLAGYITSAFWLSAAIFIDRRWTIHTLRQHHRLPLR
jgi:undecaprenyl-diphosphatase